MTPNLSRIENKALVLGEKHHPFSRFEINSVKILSKLDSHSSVKFTSFFPLHCLVYIRMMMKAFISNREKIISMILSSIRENPSSCIWPLFASDGDFPPLLPLWHPSSWSLFSRNFVFLAPFPYFRDEHFWGFTPLFWSQFQAKMASKHRGAHLHPQEACFASLCPRIEDIYDVLWMHGDKKILFHSHLDM